MRAGPLYCNGDTATECQSKGATVWGDSPGSTVVSGPVSCYVL
jgi:hypothetical protein